MEGDVCILTDKGTRTVEGSVPELEGPGIEVRRSWEGSMMVSEPVLGMLLTPEQRADSALVG